jgi:hypothetical protein
MPNEFKGTPNTPVTIPRNANSNLAESGRDENIRTISTVFPAASGALDALVVRLSVGGLFRKTGRRNGTASRGRIEKDICIQAEEAGSAGR